MNIKRKQYYEQVRPDYVSTAHSRLDKKPKLIDGHYEDEDHQGNLKMDPKVLSIAHKFMSKQDEILQAIENIKTQESENLPVYVNKYMEQQDKKNRVNKIIDSHYHHPSEFKLFNWVSDLSPTSRTDIQYSQIPEDVQVFMQDIDLVADIEKIYIEKNPIIFSSSLAEVLTFYYKRGFLFNFLYIGESGKQDCILVGNVCEFDMIYFCISMDIKDREQFKYLTDITFSSNILLLHYSLNSSSVSNEEEEKLNDNDKDKKKEEVNQEQHDNIQKEEYLNVVKRLVSIQIKISFPFFMTCPCFRDKSISSGDAKSCIFNESLLPY